MAKCAPFHSQITNIIEVLAQTAIAEICALVDDGYAVLHMEISRSQRENRALKRKLQMSKLRKPAPSQRLLSNACDRLRLGSKLRPAAAERCTPDSPFGMTGRYKPGQPAMPQEFACTDEDRLLRIKEEMVEEDFHASKLQEKFVEEHAVARRTEPETVAERPSLEHCSWEVIELDSRLKIEPSVDASNKSPMSARYENNAGHSGHESHNSPRLDELDMLFSQGKSKRHPEEPACSYELENGPSALKEKTRMLAMDPTAGEEWSSGWMEEGTSATTNRYMNALPSEVPNKANPQLDDSSIAVLGRLTDSMECDVRGNHFNLISPKNLEMHQRIHAGEKPFTCPQCGKTFSQSSHLKKHLIIHTGERPFRCPKCAKCFANSSNLKRHQTVHTGERPFCCAQCGRRFSFVGNLKRHQSIHIRTKPLTSPSALWGDVQF